MLLSVVICTHNPNVSVFERVIDGLKTQLLEKDLWEVIVVDNCSTQPVTEVFDFAWHPNARVIFESKPGLSHARVAGVEDAQTELIVFVDDDNVLDKEYLATAFAFHKSNRHVGCFGGKSLANFETIPPSWFESAGINLGCQNFGDDAYVSNYAADNFKLVLYPQKAPIGTGMVILKKAFLGYLEDAAANPERMKLGRRGKSLSSGEDNDIILSIIKNGYEIAYVPTLVVHHLIPANRYSTDYLKRMAFESNRSWVKVLHVHGINPWKKISKFSYGPRKIKSYLQCRAWQSQLAAIRWKSSCGLFKGLSEL